MQKQRLLFIDNLRILLIALVIMVHLSVTYGGEGSWYYKEGQPDIISLSILTLHNAIVQSFFMGFLFLIAGYFTPASYDRKGPWPFLRHRLLRLGIPMLCYDFAIQPLLAYPLMAAGTVKFDGSFGEFLAMYYSSFHVGTGPLWFVETLLIFALVYVVWRRLAKSPVGPSQRSIRVPANKTVAAFAFALGIVTFVVRIPLPVGWAFGPLNLQFPFFAQYICLFIVGIVAYRRGWLVNIPNTMGRFWLGVAAILIVVLLPVLFVLGGATTGDVTRFLGGAHWQCFVHALWEQFLAVAVVIALSVLFREKLNHQGRLARAASASSYTAYIIHAPVLILFTLAIRNVKLYPLLKFALAAVVAVPLCFALGNLIRQLPLARRIL